MNLDWCVSFVFLSLNNNDFMHRITSAQYIYIHKTQQFYLTQLRTPNQELAYFIGIQAAVESEGPGQAPSNPGWVYSLGNHV